LLQQYVEKEIGYIQSQIVSLRYLAHVRVVKNDKKRYAVFDFMVNRKKEQNERNKYQFGVELTGSLKYP
jgi:hypothetical protein